MKHVFLNVLQRLFNLNLCYRDAVVYDIFEISPVTDLLCKLYVIILKIHSVR